MGGGPPGFPRGFTCPAVLRVRLGGKVVFDYRAVTFYGGSFQNHFAYYSPFSLHVRRPTTPKVTRRLVWAVPVSLAATQGIAFCFLFLGVLRCFSSPGLPLTTLWIQVAVLALQASGLPHSEISGSKLTYSSPKHIGVRPVLHRLLAPRHPPCALSSLTSVFHFR